MQFGHCSLRLAGSHANMYVHPGVGQHLRSARVSAAAHEGSVAPRRDARRHAPQAVAVALNQLLERQLFEARRGRRVRHRRYVGAGERRAALWLRAEDARRIGQAVRHLRFAVRAQAVAAVDVAAVQRVPVRRPVVAKADGASEGRTHAGTAARAAGSSSGSVFVARQVNHLRSAGDGVCARAARALRTSTQRGSVRRVVVASCQVDHLSAHRAPLMDSLSRRSRIRRGRAAAKVSAELAA